MVLIIQINTAQAAVSLNWLPSVALQLPLRSGFSDPKKLSSRLYPKERAVVAIFEGLNFRGLGTIDDFVSLYFRGTILSNTATTM